MTANRIVNPNVITENEAAARKSYERGDYVACFLMIHTLLETLLRAFVSRTGKERFSDLVEAYQLFLKKEKQPEPVFVDELLQFNRRRNRVVHNLWKNGYVETNRDLDPACRAAFIMYGLFIEWLETFHPKITQAGFSYDK